MDVFSGNDLLVQSCTAWHVHGITFRCGLSFHLMHHKTNSNPLMYFKCLLTSCVFGRFVAQLTKYYDEYDAPFHHNHFKFCMFFCGNGTFSQVGSCFDTHMYVCSSLCDFECFGTEMNANMWIKVSLFFSAAIWIGCKWPLELILSRAKFWIWSCGNGILPTIVLYINVLPEGNITTGFIIPWIVFPFFFNFENSIVG